MAALVQLYLRPWVVELTQVVAAVEQTQVFQQALAALAAVAMEGPQMTP